MTPLFNGLKDEVFYSQDKQAVVARSSQTGFESAIPMSVEHVIIDPVRMYPDAFQHYTLDPPIVLQPGRYILRIENSIPCFIPIQ